MVPLAVVSRLIEVVSNSACGVLWGVEFGGLFVCIVLSVVSVGI